MSSEENGNNNLMGMIDNTNYNSNNNNNNNSIRLARQQEVFEFVEKANDAEKANEFPSATHLFRQAIISLSYLQSMENEKEKKV